jgi:hypothetical protein
MDGDEVREEQEHDGDDSVETAIRDRCTVTRTTAIILDAAIQKLYAPHRLSHF